MDINKIRYLEKIAADGHKALEIMEYKDWELRFSQGYTGRANSIRIIGAPIEEINSEVEEKLQYAEKEYAKRGLPCLFKLTEADKKFSDYLETRGYTAFQPTDIMIMPLNSVKSIMSDTRDIYCGSEPDGWFEPYFEFEGMTDPTQQELCRQIHANVSIDKSYIKVFHEDRVAAVASLATEDGYSLLHNVVVDPTLRGQGLGKKLCRAAIIESKNIGADYSYLQVIETNDIAIDLYKKLGYEKLYTYWYIRKKF